MSQASDSQRRPLIVANWKMFKTAAETEAFAQAFLPQVPKSLQAEVAICPPFPWLSLLGQLLKGSSVSLGAQNVNENAPGAFTGCADEKAPDSNQWCFV